MAEDGPIAPQYLVTELPGAGYRQRTRQNVVDSDGTLVVYFGELAGGTRETVRFCERLRKPVLVIDGAVADPTQVAAKAANFVKARARDLDRPHPIAVLNVAGPRENSHPGARAYAEVVVRDLLVLLPTSSG